MSDDFGQNKNCFECCFVNLKQKNEIHLINASRFNQTNFL